MRIAGRFSSYQNDLAKTGQFAIVPGTLKMVWPMVYECVGEYKRCNRDMMFKKTWCGYVVKLVSPGNRLVFALHFLFRCLGGKNSESPSFSLKMFSIFLFTQWTGFVLGVGRSRRNVTSDEKFKGAYRVCSND